MKRVSPEVLELLAMVTALLLVPWLPLVVGLLFHVATPVAWMLGGWAAVWYLWLGVQLLRSVKPAQEGDDAEAS